MRLAQSHAGVHDRARSCGEFLRSDIDDEPRRVQSFEACFNAVGATPVMTEYVAICRSVWITKNEMFRRELQSYIPKGTSGKLQATPRSIT